jgi:hypothetical protein
MGMSITLAFPAVDLARFAVRKKEIEAVSSNRAYVPR